MKRRTPESAGEDLSTTLSWIDALNLNGVSGWLYWPSASCAIRATVNDIEVPVDIKTASRPDVRDALSLQRPADGFHIRFDLAGTPVEQHLRIVLEHQSQTQLLVDEPASSLLVKVAMSHLGEPLPEAIVRAGRSHFRGRSAPPGLADGAIRFVDPNVTASQALPAFFHGSEGLGPRPDVLGSPFQAHVYYRHVRDHPSYRLHRHFTLETEAATRRFLTWSLRNYSSNYTFAPLPIGDADLAHLNRPVEGSGLLKGRSGALGDVPLTASQADFALERYGTTQASSDVVLADWLLAWLGSWGWGHRGLVLLSPEQRRFFTEPPPGESGPGTLGHVTALNRFSLARLREHPELQERFSDLNSPSVRMAYLLTLMADESTHVGTHALLPRAFSAWLSALKPDLLIQASDRAAVTSTATRNFDVRVLGMLDSKSGLGQNARQSVAAFRAADLLGQELSLSINDRSTDQSLRSSYVEGDHASVNLWHLNPDNLCEAVSTISPTVHDGAYNIGFFAWELDLQPRAHDLALRWVDEIWTPSEYCAESFRRAVPNVPVIVMPHCLVIPDDVNSYNREHFGLENDTFLVHYSFDMHSWPQRKNPLGAIAAFQEAFQGRADARLLLKIRNGQNVGLVDSDLDRIGDAVLDLSASDPRVLVDVAERTYSETLALIAISNVHLSLHRSEGFGYSLAESLALGTPLVATDFSGSRDFLDEENCWLVPAQERFLYEGEYYLAPPGARWAEPDIAVAVAALRAVYDGGEAVDHRRRAGLATAQRAFSLATMAERYATRITQIKALRRTS